MSAIGISNVFNTISTNINLRRREFANLKSIGMTDKQFRKMLDLECIFYGTKALLFGIPIGVLICYLLNLGFGNMFEFIFRIPWLSIVICIIAIYTIVFVTMIYSTKKVRKENIIDSNICTVCNSDLFHSYRKDKELSGRNGAFIGMV